MEAFADTVWEAQRQTPRSGVRLDVETLHDVARKTRQTINGQFIGVPPEATVPVEEFADNSKSGIRDAALVVKAVDSSFWIVVTKSPADIERLRSRFRDVRETDGALELGLQIGP